jgi:peptide chain release factor 2
MFWFLNWNMIGGLFDIGQKEKELERLRQELTEERVWSDHKLSGELSAKSAEIEREINGWKTIRKKINDLRELVELVETEEDADLLRQAEAEYQTSRKILYDLEIEMIFQGETDKNNAFLNIHPGAGGTESQDWAEMLLRMYQRWAENRGFGVEVVSFDPGDVAGLKDAYLFIKGKYAFGYLKAENGIHRLVRLSPFNANNKRQTSFCSVAVSPEVSNDIEIQIDPKDLKVDTYRSGGAGGQYVNKTESAVRITHLPTGIVVACQVERSQLQNREMAMRMLKSKLYEYEKRKQDAEIARNQLDRKSIEWGNQIRSYVFQPYTLAKDHRTGFSRGDIQKVMDGDIDDFIIAYLKGQRAGDDDDLDV